MIRTYAVELEGSSPLLMHADDIGWSDAMDAWKDDPANKKKSKPGDDRTPAYRWVGYTYHNDETVCVPSANLAKCLMEGGAMVPVPGGRSGKTFKAQTQSGMKIDSASQPLLVAGKPIPWEPIHKLMDEEDFSQHLQAAKKMRFSLFVKRAGIPGRSGGKKHVRVRPRFDGWSLRFTVSVWDEQLTLEILKDIVTYTGAYKGLGDWRPGSPQPGSHGMFKLKALKKA